MAKTKQKFDANYKLHICELVHKSGLTITQVCTDKRLGLSILYRWLSQYDAELMVTQEAAARILGKKLISSLKSYFGCILVACGSMKAWLSIEMMHRNKFIATLNLEKIDPLCW